jgi:hypothetical protein
MVGNIMLNDIIPYGNIIAGILIFIVGFILHFIGQLISFANWDYATKIGFQEKKMLPEFKVYEHGIAGADVFVGWIYIIVVIGLFLDISWAYKLAWFPGVVLIYHGLSALFWMGNQNKLGHPMNSNKFRISWFLLNFLAGIIVILIIW